MPRRHRQGRADPPGRLRARQPRGRRRRRRPPGRDRREAAAPVRWADTDGNVHFYGFECVNRGDGKDPWPEEQLLAVEQVAAAICRFHGWSERSVIGHLEWRPGKVDPTGFSMDRLRERVRERLK
ncbi:N-acetylmuramoyl-L-alanine amidase [Streptomyces stramineus]